MGLITAGGGGVDLRMGGGDTGLLQEMTHPHHRVRIQVGLTQTGTDVDPGFLAGRHPDLQASVIKFA
jgi:hypothetical protein